MYPILTRYGSIFIYSYTVLLAAGILIAIALTARLNQKMPAAEWFDAALLVLLAAVVGGRLGFVIFRWDYFQDRIPETWQIWRGGYSYLPALLAGIAALIFWTALKKQPFYEIAGLLSPAFVIIMASGWAACLMEGCAFGQTASAGLLSADLPDDLGVYAIRYQSQAIGLVLGLLLFVLIVSVRQRTSPAILFLFTLAGVSAVHFIVSLLRGDAAPELWGLRLDLLLNGLLILFAAILLLYMRGRSHAA